MILRCNKPCFLHLNLLFCLFFFFQQLIFFMLTLFTDINLFNFIYNLTALFEIEEYLLELHFFKVGCKTSLKHTYFEIRFFFI